ncbi:OprD family outer membrane porin [Sulfurimonas diazotrophicus]|uniref:OprD family outer membrane porin n=1 Tax=Sulfurimonas diazotrophicus TaxID=3131939 RepID=A0ABZ3H7D0_9BACT
MRKTLLLSGIAAAFLTANAADDIAAMFANGTTSGQIRAFYVDRDYSGYDGAPHRNATALGGHLGYETDALAGVSLGASAYTTNRIFQGLEYGSTSEGKVDPSLFGNGYKSYSIFGEAYVNLKMGASNLKLGRQSLNTPMAAADDARMLPSFFEAYVYTNGSLANTSLVAAHITKFAPGSFSNIYTGGGILGATSGYSPIAANYPKYGGDFANVGSWAVGETTAGITTLAAVYKDEYLSLQAWDYYAWDILNAFYAEGSVSWKCLLNPEVKPFFSAQLIKENNVGDNLLQNLGGDGKIDSLYGAVKLGAKYHGFSAYAAYSQTTANSDADITGTQSYANAVITPWGGMPAYTQGMVTRHQFMAGTKAYKGAVAYSFKEQGVNLSVAAYYVAFDMDKNNGYSVVKDVNGTVTGGYAWTAAEPGFDIQYYPEAVKNLQLRLRGNFPDKFYDSAAKTVNWDEYRFIVNYNF